MKRLFAIEAVRLRHVRLVWLMQLTLQVSASRPLVLAKASAASSE